MSDAENQRAESLAAEAKACIDKRELQIAYQLAKEALSLAPSNTNVQSVISQLQKSDSNPQILPLCRSYIHDSNYADGVKALQFLKQRSPIPFQDVTELATIFFDQTDQARHGKHHAERPSILDDLTGAFVTGSQPARVEFAARFSQSFAVGDPNRLFNLFYSRGEDSFSALTQAVVDDSIWASPEQYKAAKRDAFQLALGKLLEPALDNPEWLMTLVTRLLATHAEDLREQPQSKLQSLLIPENFEIVLYWLDLRASEKVRSQALLATTKFLEDMKEGGKGEATVKSFVTDNVAKTHNDDLIIAFSAATACFPLIPQTISELFLTPGFLQGLVPTLERNILGSRKSHTLEKASLQLMSAACIDKNCREAIHKECSTYLDDVANTHEEEEYASLAALVLSKIGQQAPAEQSGIVADVDGLSTTLINMTLNSTTPAARQSSIEGLAYTSLKPKVKEEIMSNKEVVKTLIDTLKANAPTDTATFGILTVFANVTAYRPTLTEEQKKMSQLSSYANSSKPPPEDPLDDDAKVAARCKKALDAGIVPALVSHPVKTLSAIGLNQTVMILNALAREQKHRGILAQQGAVKLLLQATERLQGTGAQLEAPSRIAAHALARILISVNPTHVFSSTLPATSALRPLTSLLVQDPEAETRNLLPTFEALLALTNLASTEDDTVRESLIRTSWQKIEDLLLSQNTLIQRASVECICNLMASPSGVAKFADGSPPAKNRLHILLALADVEDLATRRAAGGALAMLTEWDRAAEAVLLKERGAKILVDLCKDEDEGIRHRGIICLLNLVSVPDSGVKARAMEAITKADGVEVLKGLLRKSRDQEVLGAGVEVLKVLLKGDQGGQRMIQ